MEHNQITISYEPQDHFGEDSINIDIKRTSAGAIKLLAKGLEKLKEEEQRNACGTIVGNAYNHLLGALSKSIKEKICN